MQETTESKKTSNLIKTLITFTPAQKEWLENQRKTRGKMASVFVRDLVDRAMMEERKQVS
jgi:hypothetical protein